MRGFELRVRGRVQGVGFRPAVWRIAHELRLAGEVLNDGEGVLVRVGGSAAAVDTLINRMRQCAPPLARIDRIDRRAWSGELPAEFRIAASLRNDSHTEVTPDAAICPACAAEIADPASRRYRYPFTNCTHCGPRLSIVTAIPYDRAATTMARFTMCRVCQVEYGDPADRRFHAQPIACPDCGPQARLIALDTGEATGAADPVAVAATLIRDGAIVAIKALGGYHLACDATNAAAVARLRQAKRRLAKPFALMAADLATIRRYCEVDATAEQALRDPAAPIVLLPAIGRDRLPSAVAPGLVELGFMLPSTPLHLLLMQDCDRPLVMTSGNLAEEAPIIDNNVACDVLRDVASHVLLHDRAIANRVDDSVVRIMAGASRVLRRARGFAPAPIPLPDGFEDAPPLLAMGGELKATFCLLRDAEAILSQHIGDLESASVLSDYRSALALYQTLFQHTPAAWVIDAHPEYLSSKLARDLVAGTGHPLLEVQHHHAHIAACLAENARPRSAPAVLGIVLDGLGYGDDGTIWGGEFLLADYRDYRRVARLQPVAMPGGAQAVREPWRNLYAHALAALGPACITDLPALRARLEGRPLRTLDGMIANGINAPLASSCGRLFDAVAAALGVCVERQAYEGEAAMRLEALATQASWEERGYPFDLTADGIAPAPLWRALFTDLANGVAAASIAARFQRGLAEAVVDMAMRLAAAHACDTVALSGGCWQNKMLFERTVQRLSSAGLNVLSHRLVPPNDGGLALGQAVIGAARLTGG